MFPYFITLIAYIILEPIAFFLTKNIELSIIVKILGITSLLIIYRKHFKFRVKFDFLSILTGIAIVAIWIFLDPLYFRAKNVITDLSLLWIFLKLLSGVAIAPVVEEFFTRYFLARWIIDKDYASVELGKFTLMSFIVTVFFFGLSHDRWLAGLITGILLNLLIYYKRDIGCCVIAHAVANLILGVYVVYFWQWQFW